MSFNPLHFPHIFQPPRLVSEVSAWIQHIPFAFLLTQLLQPRSIVELGVHMGDSYCAFCQAVDTLQLPTRCTGIDTWQGDPQAGHYDSTVLATLRAHHDPLYARFSTLHQSTFDAAASTFENASIDLLHIDGSHTYEAVAHDLYTWLPKLSPRAVLLLHDTAVHLPTFGVHKLFAQLSAHHPAFEFLHGSGLGIVCIGTEIPAAFTTFLAEAQASPQPLRQFFAALGHNLEISRSLYRITQDQHAQHDHLTAWRTHAGLPPRDPFPTPISTEAFLTDSHPDLKTWADSLVAAASANLLDVMNLTEENRNFRNHLFPGGGASSSRGAQNNPNPDPSA